MTPAALTKQAKKNHVFMFCLICTRLRGGGPLCCAASLDKHLSVVHVCTNWASCIQSRGHVEISVDLRIISSISYTWTQCGQL